mmetsp:Transcript_4934/g.2759  ORF Transcript_4934/g.2759 Transcript_4934/m.2759 type:complete len:91 (+) Transcript_4934:676-948(+)
MAIVSSSNTDYDKEIALSITVYVPYEDLEARIIGGTNRESSFYVDLVLDAGDSNDPNNNPLTYLWSCALLNGSECLDSDDQNIFIDLSIN